MTEIPLNVTDGKTVEASETQNQKTNRRKRALRPKARAAPLQQEVPEEPASGLTKPPQRESRSSPSPSPEATGRNTW